MTTDRSGEQLRAEICALGPWFHNLHLPEGLETAPDHPLGDFPACKWRQIAPHLPECLDGWHVLDVGCNAGFYSFELARRGARVTAIDHDSHYLAQARWAAQLLPAADRIHFAERDAYSLAGDAERYDLVLFLGILYHLRYPLLVLDTLARLRPRLLLLQTLTAGGDAAIGADDTRDLGFETRHRLTAPGFPRMSFIEHAFASDPTNWWVPDRACVLAMLRSAGFDTLSEPGHEIFLCTPRAARVDDHARRDWDAVFPHRAGPFARRTAHA